MSKKVAGRQVAPAGPVPAPARRVNVANVELCGLVKEYLDYHDFNVTVAAFQSECASKGFPLGPPMNMRSKATELQNNIKSALVTAFQQGQHADYFATWDQYIAPKAPHLYELQEMEFYLNIYFAIYTIHPHIRHKGGARVDLSKAMEAYKMFLETRGADLSKTEQFLPFYALPYVPDPRAHPSFKELFKDTWLEALEVKLELFVEKTLRKPVMPRLLQMLENKSVPVASDEATANYIASMQANLRVADEREAYHMSRQQKLQVDYQNLISISSELVQLLASSLKGEQISSEYLGEIVQQLMDFKKSKRESPVPLYQPMPVLRSFSGHFPVTGTAALTSQIEPALSITQIQGDPLSFIAIDVERVKTELLTYNTTDAVLARKQAILAQALRMRMEHGRADHRKREIDAFQAADVFGLRDDANASNQHSVLDFFDKAYPFRVYKEQIAKLLNAAASDIVARDYFCASHRFLSMVSGAMMAEPRDTILRQNLLGVLEKLSVRRKVQSQLISLGLIPYLLSILNDHVDHLNDDSAEYAVALLMNLASRTAGKKQCAQDAERLLNTLSGLMEHENAQVKTYVNGILYTIFFHPGIRQQARNMGFEDIVAIHKTDADEATISQMDYALQQLHTNEEHMLDEESLDGDDMDDVDDVDEDLPRIEDENEELVLGDDETSGEAFLQQHYAAVSTASSERSSDAQMAKSSQPSANESAENKPPQNKWAEDQTTVLPESPEPEVPKPGEYVTMPPPPSEKLLKKAKPEDGTAVTVEEYGKAFASRSRVVRTPLPAPRNHPQASSRASSKLSFYAPASGRPSPMPPMMPPSTTSYQRHVGAGVVRRG